MPAAVEETRVCTTCGRRFGDDALFCPRDGSALVPASAAKGKDAFVGREILGHIEIRSLIGAGAMGRVYRAYQRGIDRDVAVKILHKELAQSPDLVARFLREAKVASKLDHPNVVKVLLAGQLDDGTMYLVMEYLDGISLHSALLAAGGALPITRVLHVALQMCDAVGEAHHAGVVHRDVKPENVMLVKRGDDLDFVKVLDFGIARLGQTDGTRSGVETQAGLVFGTARYLSPEGARGEPVAPSSDVYALATVVFQTLAGRTPFEHDSSVSLLVAQIHDPPPMLRSVGRASYVPAAIEAAIMKNLAKNPAERDPDGHAFGRALLDAAVSAGFAETDLLNRPAVAKGRRPAASQMWLPSSEKTREENFGLDGRSPIAGRISDTPLAPRTHPPEPFPSVYHPSYSGRPADVIAQEPRRIAKTLDEQAHDSPGAHEPPSSQRIPTPAPIPAPTPSTVAAIAPDGGTMLASAMPTAGPTPEPTLGSTRGEERLEAQGVPRGNRYAALWLVLVLGAVGATGIGGYRLGYFGTRPVPTRQAEVDDLLTRAQVALDARRWDAPAGENVVDLTDKLIALVPGETRTYQIRNSASDRIMREGLDRKAQADLPGAIKLLRLAARLSPPDRGLQKEIEDVEGDLAQDPRNADLVTDGGAGRFHLLLKLGSDLAGDQPHPGEPVPLVAVVSGDPPPKGLDPKAHFILTGPGLAPKGVELATRVEKTTRYVTSYAFPQAGTYRVHFYAKPDGFPVQDEGELKVAARSAGATWTSPSPPNSGRTTGIWPAPSTRPTWTSPTGTVTLTPDPVPLPMPTATTPPPPPPLPVLP